MKNNLIKILTATRRWTYEIHDNNQIIVPEATVVINNTQVKKINRKTWDFSPRRKKINITYTDAKFIQSHVYIRLLEANGDAIGILRLYEFDNFELWTMYGLKLEHVSRNQMSNSVNAILTFRQVAESNYSNVAK